MQERQHDDISEAGSQEVSGSVGTQGKGAAAAEEVRGLVSDASAWTWLARVLMK